MITIHPPVGAPPAALVELTRTLVALAGGRVEAVRTGRGGVVVDDDLAYAYLSLTLTTPAAADLPPAVVASPQLAGVVRAAEIAGGWPTARAAPAATPARTSNQRRQRRTPPPAPPAPPAHTEEHAHV